MARVEKHERSAPQTTALLLIAHGSRQPDANADLFHLADQLRGQGRYAIVETSFLELAEPNIEQGAEACVSQGASRVFLLPYFLSAGVHVQRDLTAHQKRLSETFPNVEFRLGQPLGRHPLLAEIVSDRARELEE